MEMRSIVSYVFIALVASCTPGSTASADVSGLYLYKRDSDIKFIQLVEGPDDTITGRLEEYSLTPKGRIETHSISLKGAVSEDLMILTPKNILTGLGLMPSLTGQLSGKKLTITWEENSWTLHKTTLAKREAAISELREYGNTIAVYVEIKEVGADFFTAEEQLQLMEAEKDATVEWLEDTTEEFEALRTEMNNVARQISAFVEADYNWKQKNALIDEYYEFENQLSRLAREVQQRGNRLSTNIGGVQDQFANATKFCTEAGIEDQSLNFCPLVGPANDRLNDVISSLKPRFAAWEAAKD